MINILTAYTTILYLMPSATRHLLPASKLIENNQGKEFTLQVKINNVNRHNQVHHVLA